MTTETSRRSQLAEAATDHVLEHGLIGLSLRPLARAVGTSDRMLLYHFRDKEDLVATVLQVANDRSIAGIGALPPSAGPADAVLDLWATLSAGEQARCARIYVEASALGVLGEEPYAGSVAEANRAWLAALAAHLGASGVPEEDAARLAALVDATFMGLQLDQQLDDGAACRRTAEELARLVGLGGEQA